MKLDDTTAMRRAIALSRRALAEGPLLEPEAAEVLREAARPA